MGVIFSYCKYLYQKRTKNSQEKLDFEGLKLFFYVTRYYHDGFFDILIKHNLYGKHEQVSRTLQVSNLDPEYTKEFTKLLVNYDGKGMVYVDKDRGLYLSGKIYVRPKNANSKLSDYIELVSLLNTSRKLSSASTTQKDEEKDDEKYEEENDKKYDLEIVIENPRQRKISNSLSNHKIIDNFIQL